jgi:sugar lactone lactonase YvrE
MRKLGWFLVVMLTALGLVTVVAASSLVTVTAFDPAVGQLPEGLALDAQGNLYVGFAPTGEIDKLTPTGAATPYAQLPNPQPTQGFLTGLVFGPQGDDLYAALASFDPETHGIWRVRQGGSVVERFAALDPQTLPNGLVFRGDTLYVTDSFGGQVWAIDPQGSARIWKADPLLLGDATVNPLGLSIGANGIALQGSFFYVANNDFGRIVRIPVNADGSAGATEMVADAPELLRGADGIVFDEAGQLYVAVNGSDRLVAVTPEPGGAMTVLAEGAPLDFPASLAVRGGDLYLTNFALLRAQAVVPGVPAPGVLKLALAAPAAPAPAPTPSVPPLSPPVPAGLPGTGDGSTRPDGSTTPLTPIHPWW